MSFIKLINLIFIIFAVFLTSCSSVRESAGVTRKTLDETKAIVNPPLILPPNFNLVAPDQLQQKNIDNVEKELAQEILFGLDQNEQPTQNETSTMNQILSKANATNISNDIRDEINQEFYKEKKTQGIYELNWENEEEVLDAVEESGRIRSNNFQNKSIEDDKIPVKKEKVKVKKKKRFLFF
tara:strand:+ start:579 stop:1124 length:546 start_codon:yes stop_codon:yes gene_type:complete